MDKFVDSIIWDKCRNNSHIYLDELHANSSFSLLYSNGNIKLNSPIISKIICILHATIDIINLV